MAHSVKDLMILPYALCTMRKRSSSMETLGIFKDVETAARGVESLINAGFTEEQITSLTSVPYPDGVLVKTDDRTWFHWFALTGGIVGASAGLLLAVGTAWVYPVQTGDKPIITFYPTGIVTFELAMLFAVIGTIAGMFLEMRLPPRGKRPYDPAISEGHIGISVSVASRDQGGRAEEIMKQAGALRTTAEEMQ
jgi:hypothetical protein